jgi:hypothetical protein
METSKVGRLCDGDVGLQYFDCGVGYYDRSMYVYVTDDFGNSTLLSFEAEESLVHYVGVFRNATRLVIPYVDGWGSRYENFQHAIESPTSYLWH